MGGRGASSSTSTSKSSSSLTSGSFSGSASKMTDKLVNEALKEYKGIEINNKLKENLAKSFLEKGIGENPKEMLKNRIKKLQEGHDKDVRESKGFKKEYAEMEKYAKQQSDLATKYAHEDKKIKAIDVRGRTYDKMSKRASEQTAKAVELNRGLTLAKKNQKIREQSIKDYKKTVSEKIKKETRAALLAEDYLKKKRKK